jgi:hypothetical protein
MRQCDWILGGTALALVIDLLLFPWHKIPGFDFGPLGKSGGTNRTGLQSPNSFWGILAFLVAIAIVAVVVIRRLTTVKLPDLPISWADALFYAPIAALVLLLIKLIAETSYLGFPLPPERAFVVLIARRHELDAVAQPNAGLVHPTALPPPPAGVSRGYAVTKPDPGSSVRRNRSMPRATASAST